MSPNVRPPGKFQFGFWNCENIREHTLGPRDYIEWHEWAEEMSKTHVQVKCEGCKRYAIWVPKPIDQE